MASWGRGLRGRALTTALVLALAAPAAARTPTERWTADVVIALDAAGRPLLPDLDAARRRAGVPSPRAASPNQLRFTFNSPAAPWSRAERATLATVLGDCYPVIREIYGDPAFDLTVNVRRDPGLGYEGVYDPSHNEMRLRSAAQPDVICHELMHAFRDDHVIGLSSVP